MSASRKLFFHGPSADTLHSLSEELVGLGMVVPSPPTRIDLEEVRAISEALRSVGVEVPAGPGPAGPWLLVAFALVPPTGEPGEEGDGVWHRLRTLAERHGCSLGSWAPVDGPLDVDANDC